MMNIGDYCGDERFEQTLKEAECPTSLPEIKMCILGSIAATEMVVPSRLIEVFWDKGAPCFKDKTVAQEFFGNLMSLWNLLAGHQDGSPCALTPFSAPENSGDLERRLNIRRAEIAAFVRGLGMGGTDPEAMLPGVMDALKHLAEVDTFYQRFLALMQKDKALPKDAGKKLDGLDAVFLDCVSRIMVGQTEQRRMAMQNPRKRGVVRPSDRSDKSSVGRNAPCPCGSGKKFKNCCGP